MLAKQILQSIPGSIRVIRRQFVKTLDSSVTFDQLRILKMVNDDMGQKQISEMLQISMAAVSKSIDGLSNKKFLVRKPGKDKRCHQLVITALGAKKLKKYTSLVEQRLNEGLKNLTASEQEDLVKGLVSLDKLMQFMNEV